MHPNPAEPAGTGGARREELLARYIDRLNAGEAVDADRIRREHPECAEALVELLKQFEGFGRPGEDAGLTDIFGDYRIVREIGRGGMGVVYEALDPSMDRRVALKVLSAGLLVDAKSVERFRREARAVGKLSHPSIVAVFATGVQRDTPYIAMELVEGESLERVLERKRPAPSLESRSAKPSSSDLTRPVPHRGEDGTVPVDAPNDARNAGEETWSPIPSSPDDLDLSYSIRMAGIFAEAAEALQHAHSRGIVHRDLKPSNLILTPDHRLRILDFGLARVEGQENLTASGEVLGTPRYMSPEQVRALIGVDHRTDIYSLGATLYEVLTLRPPIGGRNVQDTLNQIVSREPPSPRRWNPRVPRDLETIVLKCLRKDPRDRYQTASELVTDLRRFTRGDPILARPQSLGEKLIRNLRRHRVRIAAAAVFSVLLAMAIYFGLRSARDAGNLREARYREVMEDAVGKLLTGGALAEHLGGFAWNQSGMDAERLSAGLEFESELISQAESELQGAIEEMPDRPDAYYHLARCLVVRGKTPRAQAALERAIALGFVPAMVLQAGLLDTAGEAERASALRERARRTKGADWVESWIAGRRALDEKRWKDAAASFGELIDLLRTGRQPYLGCAVEVYLSCGLAHLQAGEYEKARGCFAAASALRQSAEPEIFLGFTLYAENRIEDAERTFEKVVARYADLPAVQTEITGLIVSVLWARFQDVPRAVTWAERMAPGYERELWRASCLGTLGRTDEALAAAEELVRLRPDVGLSYYLAAVANMTAGRLHEAEELAKEACRRLPTSSAPYSVLSWSLAMQKRYIEASIFLNKAVQVEPGAAAPHYFLAKSYVARKDFASAEKHMKKAIEASFGASGSFFELADAHHALALALEAQGKRAEALEQFRLAAEKSRDAHFGFDLSWLRDLALRELAAGHRRQALRLLEEGLDHPFLPTDRIAPLEREVARHARALRPSLPSFRAVDLALEDLDREELVGVADLWRFHRGNEAPSPGGEWTARDFDAGQWEQGPGPFGFGGTEASTVLGDMKDAYSSLYLRARFEHPGDGDPLVERLVLSVTADGGFVAYLNGHELSRVRVPSAEGFLENTARASERVQGAPVQTQLEIDRGLLVAGPNILAIQGLSVGPSSPDFTLGARLTLELEPDAARRLARTREYVDALRNEPPTESLIAVRHYLEGRMFQIEGDHARAAERFSEVLERFPAHALPSIAFLESSRAAGRLGEGVEALRSCLEANCPGSLRVLGAWAGSSLVGLERTPAELLGSMPCKQGPLVPFDFYSSLPPDPSEHVQWALGQLESGRPFRINCGGSQLEMPGGEVFSGDRLYTTGRALRVAPEDMSIANTDRPELYLDARRFSPAVFSSPGYLLPLTRGRYRVSLHFVEFSLPQAGRRRFDVLLEDEVVLRDYDPGGAGLATADVRSFVVGVEDGLLQIRFRPRRFEPEISAIEILSADG